MQAQTNIHTWCMQLIRWWRPYPIIKLTSISGYLVITNIMNTIGAKPLALVFVGFGGYKEEIWRLQTNAHNRDYIYEDRCKNCDLQWKWIYLKVYVVIRNYSMWNRFVTAHFIQKRNHSWLCLYWQGCLCGRGMREWHTKFEMYGCRRVKCDT